MKLLLDQNLSPRLVAHLADVYPGSAHVSEFGLGEASDQTVWEFARTGGFLLVSKDADFGDLSLLRGFPPKVIRLRLGNCTTAQVEATLRSAYDATAHLVANPALGILELY